MKPLSLTDTLQHLDRILAALPGAAETLFTKSSERELIRRRLGKLRDLVAETQATHFNRQQIAEAVFPGLQPDSVRVQFSRLRTLIEKIATGSGSALRFMLYQPEVKNQPDDQIPCHFEGDSMVGQRLRATNAALEAPSRDALAAAGPVTYIEQEARPDALYVFVSFAWADRDMVNQFVQELRDALHTKGGPRIEFWKCDERLGINTGIEVGHALEASVREAMALHPVGMLLLSEAYFKSRFICQVELPHYLSDPKSTTPALGRAYPVGLGNYRPGHRPNSCSHIADSLVLFLPQKKGDTHDLSYVDLKRRDKDREEFIHAVAADLQKLAKEKSTTLPPPAKDAAHSFRLRAEEMDKLKEYADQEAVRESLGTGRQKPAEPTTISRKGAVPLVPALLAWARSGPETPAYMALLGETGAGKTMTALELTRQLLKDGLDQPLTIYLDLRRANEDGLIKRNERPLLREILESVLRRTSDGEYADAEEILTAVRKTGALLIWDGLDEVLVHLSNDAGQAFYRQLLDALPPRLVGQPGAGRVLFSCRTQYFRDLSHEADLFSGGQKEGIPTGEAKDAPKSPQTSPRARFEVLRVLPFSEAQIRAYLAANMPGLDVERAMEVISKVHNLRELAGRPYLLSLLRESLRDCDSLLASGQTVRSVDLYETMINRWLEREKTREAISRTDKQRLMGLLAHHLWAEGMKSIPIEDLDKWLGKLVVRDVDFAASMGKRWESSTDAQESLREHLRAATFLGRWDESSFRFAHTSLQEYFLALHLLETLENGPLEAWTLPLPSAETFDFLAELWAKRHAQGTAAAKRLETGLRQLLAESREGSTQNALKLYLRLQEKNLPVPNLSKIDARGLDFTAWKFHGTAQRPLRLPGVDFNEATLVRATFEHVEFTGGSLWAGADCRSAQWNACGLEMADFSAPHTKLDRALVRKCRLRGSQTIGQELLRGKVLVWLCQEATAWPESPPPTLPFAVDQLGHTGLVTSVAYSPDRSKIVSTDFSGKNRCWLVADGSLQPVPEEADAWLEESGGGRAGNFGVGLELIGQAKIRLTQNNHVLREIIPLPDGNALVLEPWDVEDATKRGHERRMRLVRGPADAWRYLSVIDRADGSLHPLESMCPEGSWEISQPPPAGLAFS